MVCKYNLCVTTVRLPALEALFCPVLSKIFAPTETPLTLRNIDEILTEVLDWHTLGIKVGIPHHLLGEIQINYSAYGVGRQRQEMITKWLEYDTKASWDKLANALKEMGKHVVAAKIWSAYVPDYMGMFAICTSLS